MSRNNRDAWKQINAQQLFENAKKEGYQVDAQVYGETGRVGFVHKNDKSRILYFFKKQQFSNASEARRDSQAVARAVSRSTGIPLHPSVPAERCKQVPSYTIGAAKLRVMHEMERREKENAYFDSPAGVVHTIIVAVFMAAIAYSACAGLVWLMWRFGMQ